MKHLIYYETFTNKVSIGIDVDGTISDFTSAFNAIYKKYFPDKEIAPADHWDWYQKMDYGGADPDAWFKEKKGESFNFAQPYTGAVESVNNIYDFVKTYGFSLKIVTNQVDENSRNAARQWLEKYGFKYDEIIFVDNAKDKWNYVDIMVDDADKVIGTKPLSKVAIKIEQLWNTNTEGDFNIPNIKGLTIDLIKQAVSKLKNKTTV